MKAHDDYKRLEIPKGKVLQPCPVCGHDAELWQYSTSIDSPTTKVVMCANGDPFVPQERTTGEGCLLYMPPDQFYRNRIVEAVKYWNEYALALMKIQRTKRWERAQILRSNAELTGAPSAKGGTHDDR